MKQLSRSPAHLLDVMENGNGESSKDQVFGTAVHCRLLEPALYWNRFAARPEGLSGVTKDGKAFKADVEAVGKTMLDHKTARWVDAVARRAKENATVQAWFDAEHQTEVSLLWERDGYLCKARADLWIPGICTIADIKTTTTASPQGFTYQIMKYAYQRQAAWYADGAQRLTNKVWDFWLIACEKSRPFLVTAYKIDPISHQRAVDENDRLFSLYKQCMVSRRWPGYGDQHEVMLPERDGLAVADNGDDETPFE
jgi:exodeoxyribonuclease VIII